MPKIAGTQTEKNLLTSFAGESQARNRYTYFAGKAKKEGFDQIAFIFEETANQEKEHAKRFFSQLEGGEIEVKWNFPAGIVGSTAENLKASAEGEYFEWSTMYPEYAKIARSEGFEAAAKIWEAVCIAEKHHEKRYRGLLSNIETGFVFKKQDSVIWRCRNCGFLHTGIEAPASCPACAHPQAYYEILSENW